MKKTNHSWTVIKQRNVTDRWMDGPTKRHRVASMWPKGEKNPFLTFIHIQYQSLKMNRDRWLFLGVIKLSGMSADMNMGNFHQGLPPKWGKTIFSDAITIQIKIGKTSGVEGTVSRSIVWSLNSQSESLCYFYLWATTYDDSDFRGCF